MPIEHLAICDSCGATSHDTGWNDDARAWDPPQSWLWVEDGVGVQLMKLYFCSYRCLGLYVTQKLREVEISAEGFR